MAQQVQLRQPMARGVAIPAPAAPPGVFVMLLTFCLMIFSTYSEGLRFGLNLPVRTVVSVLLLLVVAAQAMMQGRRIISFKLGWWLVALWGLLIVWLSISNMAKGASLTSQWRYVVGRDFTSFTAMLAIIWCARGKSRQHLMAIALCILIAISAVVGIMQWLDQGWAWKLRVLLNVPMDASEFGDVAEFTSDWALVSGLFGGAFQASYYVVIGTCLLLPTMLDSRWRFALVVPLFLIGIHMLVLQERSAVLSAILCALAFTISLLRHMKGRTLGVVLLVAMMAGGGLVTARWVARQLSGSSVRYTLYRYSDVTTGGRLVAWGDALKLVPQHWLVGAPRRESDAKASAGTAPTPHNLFINALVYFGVPGLLIVLVIAGLQTWLAYSVWKISWATSDYVAMGCALAMVGYLLNCQFHNASMLNGDYPGWWVTGLLIAARQNYRDESALRQSFQYATMPLQTDVTAWPGRRA